MAVWLIGIGSYVSPILFHTTLSALLMFLLLWIYFSIWFNETSSVSGRGADGRHGN